MNILMVSNLYPPDVIGGAEIMAANLADGLADRGHVVRVVTSSLNASTPERECRNGVDVFRVRLRGTIFPRGDLPVPLRLLHQLRVHAADVHNRRVVKARG